MAGRKSNALADHTEAENLGCSEIARKVIGVLNDLDVAIERIGCYECMGMRLVMEGDEELSERSTSEYLSLFHASQSVLEKLQLSSTSLQGLLGEATALNHSQERLAHHGS